MDQTQENKKLKKDKETEKNFLEYISKIAQRERVSLEDIQEIIKSSFRQTYSSIVPDISENLIFEFSDTFLVYKRLKKVESVIDASKEISVSSPILLKGKNDGDFFLSPINIENLPFSILQEVRKKIYQKIKEIKQNRQIQIFKRYINELIRGKILSFIPGKYCVVELEENNIGLWPQEEWGNIIYPFLNKTYLFLIKEIKEEDKKNNIILTRNNDKYLQKIIELEVPEVKSGIIKIKHIFRKAGLLSKILVESTIQSVDAIGTCIGHSACRIKKISENTYIKERIEVASWDNDKTQLLLNLLLPVRVISIFQEGDTMKVVIPADYLFGTLSKIGDWFIEIIGEYIQKKILLFAYEDESKENFVSVWNGNMSYADYLNFKKKKIINVNNDEDRYF